MNTLFPKDLTDKIHTTGCLAVLSVDDLDLAVPLANALIAGGIDIMELTLRTPVAIDALKKIRTEVPQMTAGVGTIITPDQINQAADAGAAFGVSPGTNPKVLERAIKQSLPFAPGIMTPTDIEQALQFNCRLLKFFPAEPTGGLKYLNSMAVPYRHLGIKFIPLGGVNEKNLAEYLADPFIAAPGGSWLAPPKLINEKAWPQITENARRATAIVKQIRGNK